ncbi:hypothetical protein [Streptomyces nojiriensis]
MRTADVTEVGWRVGADCLTVRALRRRGRRPARAPEPGLVLDGLSAGPQR